MVGKFICQGVSYATKHIGQAASRIGQVFRCKGRGWGLEIAAVKPRLTLRATCPVDSIRAQGILIKHVALPGRRAARVVLKGFGECWANRERPETGDRTAEASVNSELISE